MTNHISNMQYMGMTTNTPAALTVKLLLYLEIETTNIPIIL